MAYISEVVSLLRASAVLHISYAGALFGNSRQEGHADSETSL